MKAVILGKAGSTRVKNKNYRPFYGEMSLTDILLEKLAKVLSPKDIFLSCEKSVLFCGMKNSQSWKQIRSMLFGMFVKMFQGMMTFYIAHVWIRYLMIMKKCLWYGRKFEMNMIPLM